MASTISLRARTILPVEDEDFPRHEREHEYDDIANMYYNGSRDTEEDYKRHYIQPRFIVIVCALTAISIVINAYVGYIVTTEPLGCDCNLASAYETVPTTQGRYYACVIASLVRGQIK